MKSTLILFASTMALAMLVIVQCTPTPVTPPTDGGRDASSGDSGDAIARACQNLATLGCAEGNASCVTTMQHAQSTGITDLKPACLAAAKSKADVRACGSVACP